MPSVTGWGELRKGFCSNWGGWAARWAGRQADRWGVGWAGRQIGRWDRDVQPNASGSKARGQIMR